MVFVKISLNTDALSLLCTWVNHVNIQAQTIINVHYIAMGSEGMHMCVFVCVHASSTKKIRLTHFWHIIITWSMLSEDWLSPMLSSCIVSSTDYTIIYHWREWTLGSLLKNGIANLLIIYVKAEICAYTMNSCIHNVSIVQICCLQH